MFRENANLGLSNNRISEYKKGTSEKRELSLAVDLGD